MEAYAQTDFIDTMLREREALQLGVDAFEKKIGALSKAIGALNELIGVYIDDDAPDVEKQARDPIDFPRMDFEWPAPPVEQDRSGRHSASPLAAGSQGDEIPDQIPAGSPAATEPQAEATYRPPADREAAQASKPASSEAPAPSVTVESAADTLSTEDVNFSDLKGGGKTEHSSRSMRLEYSAKPKPAPRADVPLRAPRSPIEPPRPAQATAGWSTERDPNLIREPEETPVSTLIPAGSPGQQLADRIEGDLEGWMRAFPKGPTCAEIMVIYHEPEPRVREAMRSLFARRKVRLLRDGFDVQHVVPWDFVPAVRMPEPSVPDESPRLIWSDRAVLRVLVKEADEVGLVRIGQRDIALQAGVRKANITAIVRRLDAAGMITIEQLGVTSTIASIYRVLPAGRDKVAAEMPPTKTAASTNS